MLPHLTSSLSPQRLFQPSPLNPLHQASEDRSSDYCPLYPVLNEQYLPIGLSMENREIDELSSMPFFTPPNASNKKKKRKAYASTLMQKSTLLKSDIRTNGKKTLKLKKEPMSTAFPPKFSRKPDNSKVPPHQQDSGQDSTIINQSPDCPDIFPSFLHSAQVSVTITPLHQPTESQLHITLRHLKANHHPDLAVTAMTDASSIIATSPASSSASKAQVEEPLVTPAVSSNQMNGHLIHPQILKSNQEQTHVQVPSNTQLSDSEALFESLFGPDPNETETYRLVKSCKPDSKNHLSECDAHHQV